jgi:hypothetical protein
MAGTALVASGILLAAAPGTASAQTMPKKKAEKIMLHLGGYMEQWIGYSNQSGSYDNYSSVDEKSDSEIYIKGATTLDNGIRFGVTWEIEGDGSPDAPANTTCDRIDEAYLFMSGSFGRINMGEEDTASELMGYGPSIVGPVGINKSDANHDWFIDHASVNITHSMDLGMSDKHNFSYYSPRVAGFQFGASYHPAINNQNQRPTNELITAHNGFSTAVNYVNKFGGTRVAGYVGVATKEVSDTVNSSLANRNDSTGWGTGVNIGFGGFTVGAAYLSENETKTTDTLSLGVKYKAGMNAYSLGWVHAINEQSSSGNGSEIGENDYANIIAAGYERTLGPGVIWGSSAGFANFVVGEADGNDAGSLDNSGMFVVTGLKLRF